MPSSDKKVIQAYNQKRYRKIKADPSLWGKYCKAMKEYHRKNRNAINTRHINSKLISIYGINVNQYNDILRHQGGGCALCGVIRDGGSLKRRLAVDHIDHKNGKIIRGILCSSCNTMLGKIDKRGGLEFLDKMSRYIRQRKGGGSVKL